MAKTKLSKEQKEFLFDKKQVSISELYGRFLNHELLQDDYGLILALLKTIAIKEDCKIPILVFSENQFIDLEIIEKQEDF